MVSWWVTYSYLNNEQIKSGNIEIMTAVYGSSESFGSTVMSKSIGHNIYTCWRIIFHSKPTPIHGTFHKSDLNYSYLRRKYSWLPQAYSQKLIYRLSQKVGYSSKIIDPVINGLSTNELRNHLHICYHSIVKLGISGFCSELSNTSNVDSLDIFRKSVADKVKNRRMYIKVESLK